MLFQPVRNSFLFLALAAVATIVPGSTSLHAQNPPAAANQAQPAAVPPALQDPTKPEVQPPLDQDRDPIPSPDISVPETASTGNNPAGKDQIKKQANGIYTMHQDVDEVLLNCAV